MPLRKRVERLVITGLVTLAVVVLATWTLAYAFQERLVYFPGGPPECTPAIRGLDFEELTLLPADGAGVRLQAWWVQPAGEPLGAVVFSHGNGGNISHWIEDAAGLAEMGWAVLLYDYRGYGLSTGTPSEEGTYADGVAAYEFARERGFPAERIVAFGESLGGAITVELACRRPVGGLILNSAFLSLAKIGAHHYPYLPVRRLLRIEYDNAAKLPRLEAPLLVMHSRDDRTVPFAHGRGLFEAASEPRSFLETTGDHNDGTWRLRESDRARVAEFLEQVLARGR